jgi:hypothetical protein
MHDQLCSSNFLFIKIILKLVSTTQPMQAQANLIHTTTHARTHTHTTSRSPYVCMAWRPPARPQVDNMHTMCVDACHLRMGLWLGFPWRFGVGSSGLGMSQIFEPPTWQPNPSRPCQVGPMGFWLLAGLVGLSVSDDPDRSITRAVEKQERPRLPTPSKLKNYSTKLLLLLGRRFHHEST